MSTTTSDENRGFCQTRGRMTERYHLLSIRHGGPLISSNYGLTRSNLSNLLFVLCSSDRNYVLGYIFLLLAKERVGALYETKSDYTRTIKTTALTLQ